MKKYFFVLIGFLLVNSAYAYLDENSTCTSSTMNAASGNISLEAVEVPNVINIQWENADGTTYTTSTCTYDTQLQIPNAPAARLGYTFKGWRLDACSLAKLDTSINGDKIKRACLDLNGNGPCITNVNNGWAANASLYGLDTPGQWAVLFEYGVVYGEAICSQTSGTPTTAGTPDTTGAGGHCWCRATGYKENGGEKCDLASLSWVYDMPFGSVSGCARDCAEGCVNFVQNEPGFRAAVFGAAQ